MCVWWWAAGGGGIQVPATDCLKGAWQGSQVLLQVRGLGGGGGGKGSSTQSAGNLRPDYAFPGALMDFRIECCRYSSY